MGTERWQSIEDLFQAALAHAPEERSAFLGTECAGDEPLRRELESLIAHHGQASNFLEASLPQIAAELLVEGRAPVAVGQAIGHYKVIAPLGAGGMGEVYLAQDTRLDRRIALKILPPSFTANPARSLRFEQEARAASALNHPNIITVHEIGLSDGIPFMVTEFVDGQTLRQRMAAGRMTLSETLEVACQAANALAAAHGAGIVHRDIKPDNVMLRPDGLVKVLDFGLAKLIELDGDANPGAPSGSLVRTNLGLVMGTPHYMSPEQARGQEVDARTDIFSIGVVLFEMIAGRLPFEGATTSDVIAAILMSEPLPLSRLAPGIPSELERIVKETLAKDREKRYSSSRELLFDLRNLKQELEYQERSKRHPAILDGPSASLKLSTLEAGQARTRYYGRIAAVSVLALGVWIAAFYNTTGERRHTGVTQPPAQAKIQSIVVLPLENLSRDPQQEYFVDGMTDLLITDLAMIRSLRVISRTSAMHYKGVHKPLAEIARELNVDAVVEGTTARSGSRVRIDARLIQAATDRYLWAESYTRDLKDVLVLQDEVARDIADSIQVQLTPQEKASLTRARPINAEAYEAYLRGRYFMDKWSDQGFEKAADYFQQAIKLYPGNALAYAELANTYGSMVLRSSVPPAVGWRKAEAAANKAVELDDSAANAHTALGSVKAYFRCDKLGAEKEFKRALELDANSGEYFAYHAWFSLESGRTEEALAEKRRSLLLDPLSPLASSELGMFLIRAHRTDEAIQHLRKTVEMDPNFPAALDRLGWAYEQKGQYHQAAVELRKASDLDPTPQRLERLADVLRESGKRHDAYQVVAELVGMSKRRYVPPDLIAGTYAKLGEEAQALAWLERASEDDLPDLARSDFEGLRSNPRFRKLEERFKAAKPCS